MRKNSYWVLGKMIALAWIVMCIALVIVCFAPLFGK